MDLVVVQEFWEIWFIFGNWRGSTPTRSLLEYQDDGCVNPVIYECWVMDGNMGGVDRQGFGKPFSLLEMVRSDGVVVFEFNEIFGNGERILVKLCDSFYWYLVRFHQVS